MLVRRVLHEHDVWGDSFNAGPGLFPAFQLGSKTYSASARVTSAALCWKLKQLNVSIAELSPASYGIIRTSGDLTGKSTGYVAAQSLLLNAWGGRAMTLNEANET